MSPLIKGLLVGFAIAAPVGPIGVLCIRRSLRSGKRAGFVSGLGAATADALYGLLAVLGLTGLTAVLVEQRAWLQLGGGVFLIYLGIATLRSAPGSVSAPATTAEDLLGAYLSTFVLTLTNPMTVLSFLGIFAGLGIGAASGDRWAPALLVSGVFLGSAAWWLLLSTAAGLMGRKLQAGGLRIVNVGSGAIIVTFGLVQVISFAAGTR